MFGIEAADTPPRYYTQAASGLHVMTHHTTDGRVEILRRLFRELDLDTGDLLFILSTKPTPTRSSAREELASKFASLTKFAAPFRELTDTATPVNETASLRDEFAQNAEPFVDRAPLVTLQGRRPPTVTGTGLYRRRDDSRSPRCAVTHSAA